jgi:hypothetical protein
LKGGVGGLGDQFGRESLCRLAVDLQKFVAPRCLFRRKFGHDGFALSGIE